MEVNGKSHIYKPNFGSIKLADVNLKQFVPNASVKQIKCELHELEATDKPILSEVYKHADLLQDGIFVGIYTNFLNAVNSTTKKLNPNKKFYAVMDNGKLSAISEATINKQGICIELISNLQKDKHVKGGGTSLVVALAELAKRTDKKSLYLDVSLCDVFYNKLGFDIGKNIWDSDFKLPAYKYDTFLSTFKPKYIQGDISLPECAKTAQQQKPKHKFGFLKNWFHKIFN